MSTQKRSLIYLGLPVGVAVALLLAFLFVLPMGASAAEVHAPEAPNDIEVFINEIHYDNDGGDLDEGVEVAGPAGTDLSGWSLVGYNGSGGAPYGTVTLSGAIPDLQNGYGAIFFAFSGLQNGAPDGIALVDNGTVIQFLSYEGSFTAVGGPADGMTSEDIGVSEPSTTPIGESLQLEGTGVYYEDFSWTGPIANTYDAVNTGQTFSAVAASDLTIDKTGPSAVVAGEELVYEISIENTNIQTATNVVVTDTLPLSTTFVAASGGFTQTNPSAGVYVWELGEIYTNTQVSFNVTVTVDLTVSNGTVLTNTAEVSTDAAGDDPANNTVEHYATVYPLVSIYDIQYVVDPGTDDASPYVGQTVLVDGIVTAEPGELGSSAMVIQETSGPWQGLYVYSSGGFGALSAPRGTEVRVLGTVAEYNGLTELAATSVTVLSTGNTVPGPDLIATGDFIDAVSAEQWETVFIEFQNATVTDEDLGYGEWAFDDGSGTTVADDLGSFAYVPALGDYYSSIMGIGWYSYGAYKLEPRDDDDITLAVPPQDLGVSKTGPSTAIAGEQIAYTIQVQNPLLIPATGVILTDTLPVSVTNVISNSNALTATNLGDQIVWEFGDLAAGVTETVYLTVTVPLTMPHGFSISNLAVVTTTTPGDDPANNDAAVNTTIYHVLPIYDVQFVPDPASDDASPYAGQTVLVEGVVTARPGEIDTPYRAMVIAEPAGGPWSGLLVYQSSGLPTTINEGDYVRVLGEVQEYYNLTELNPTAGFVEVITPTYGSVPPAALTTGQLPDADPALSEQWEGVLVEFSMATVTDDNLGYGEWAFDDGSGAARANDLGEIDGNLTYVPTNGDVFNFLRGIVWYSFSNYKLEPRRDADIGLHYDTPFISKDAPVTILPNELMTYTITVDNMTGVELMDVSIYDVVPMTSTFVQALDGGAFDGISVTWDIPSIPDQTAVEVRFVVQADDEPGDNVINDTYYFEAANWVTPTYGTPVWTYIGEYIPISTIQGSDFRSPYEGQAVTTQGEVIGFFEGNSSAYGNYDGFFIQDPIGDGDPATSEAIFINHKTLNIIVNIGDTVEVNGTVDEFSEYDGADCLGNECLTQISVSDVNDVIILTMAAPQAVPVTELDPPGDPTASDIYFEALEGMLVTLPNTSTVVGPTSYGAVHVVRGDLGINRVMRGGPYEGMPIAVRNWELYGEIDGGDPPNLITGSVISNTTGPLNFSYGDYMLITQAGDEWTAEISVAPPSTVPSWPTPNVDEFSVATFNTYNFDSGEPTVKQTKVVSTILQTNGAAFIALEEIEGDDTTFMTGVLADLAAAGYNYDYAYSHSDVGGHGVSLLWNTDVVTEVVSSTGYQGCSEYGSSSSTYDPLWDTCQAMGEYPLFSRRPVVVTGTVQLDSGTVQVVVIANHFKSKLGGFSADMRRLEQGQFINGLVADFIAQGSVNVIVMGDLNDFEDSPPLEAMYLNGTLVSAWDAFDGDEPYSYIYEGVSQILDHILVSPAMNEWLEAMGPLHLNADFPYAPYTDDDSVVWRTSDHDPVAATLLLPNLDVDFTSNSPVTLGQEAAFTATLISGPEPVTYEWDFGDGSDPVMGITATHSYTTTGTFTVTLTATNEFESVYVSHEFVVEPAPVEEYVIYMPLIPKH